MKRFASHYLYLSDQVVLKQYVIEIEKGILMKMFPLSGEIESTVWIDGIIVFSLNSDYKFHKEISLFEVISELTLGISDQEDLYNRDIYVYRISPINVVDLSLLPTSSVERLA